MTNAARSTETIYRAVGAFVTRSIAQGLQPLSDRIAALELRAPVPGQKGDTGERGVDGLPGTNGRDGLNGKDGAPGERGMPGEPGKDGAPGRDGRDGAQGPAGKDGLNGKDGLHGRDADMAIVAAMVATEVQKAVGALPPPPKGEAGAAGKDGAPGEMGPQGRDGAPGRDGASVTLDDVRPVVERAVADAVAIVQRNIPTPKDGKDAAPITREQIAESVAAYLRTNPPPAGKDGHDGKDGAPGRDGKDGMNGANGEHAEIPYADDDVAPMVSKAIALLAESPKIETRAQPIVLNIDARPAQGRVNKTITTRRGKDGNIVADVTETQ